MNNSKNSLVTDPVKVTAKAALKAVISAHNTEYNKSQSSWEIVEEGYAAFVTDVVTSEELEDCVLTLAEKGMIYTDAVEYYTVCVMTEKGVSYAEQHSLF